MKLSAIISIGKEIKAAYEYRDPEKLMHEAGVISLLFPMGTAIRSLKGFITAFGEQPVITANSDLSPEMLRLVRYHEFAHYILHVRSGLQELVNDCNIFDGASQGECEANLLTAELMLEDEAALRALRECGGFFEAASALHVPPELLDFKLRLLREKGYPIPDAPIDAKGSFLRSCREKEEVNDHRKRRISTRIFREGA